MNVHMYVKGKLWLYGWLAVFFKRFAIVELEMKTSLKNYLTFPFC